MELYKHKVQYYETDKMGITHHSNYIRWMEEARIDFLSEIGWDYAKLEGDGIVSPVTSATCKYRKPTTFGDEISIAVSVVEFKGVRLVLQYRMIDIDGEIVCEGMTEHCFMDSDGKLIHLKKKFPEFHNLLIDLAN